MAQLQNIPDAELWENDPKLLEQTAPDVTLDAKDNRGTMTNVNKVAFWTGFSERALHLGFDPISITKLAADVIPGGLAAGMPDKCFPKTELKEGIEVEHEHTPSNAIAKEIAKDHLVEHKNYYKRLEQAGL